MVVILIKDVTRFLPSACWVTSFLRHLVCGMPQQTVHPHNKMIQGFKSWCFGIKYARETWGSVDLPGEPESRTISGDESTKGMEDAGQM